MSDQEADAQLRRLFKEAVAPHLTEPISLTAVIRQQYPDCPDDLGEHVEEMILAQRSIAEIEAAVRAHPWGSRHLEIVEMLRRLRG